MEVGSPAPVVQRLLGRKTAAKMSEALSEHGATEEDETPEDLINRLMEARKMLENAIYFVFTATPKNKTLEIDPFGRMPARDRDRVGVHALSG